MTDEDSQAQVDTTVDSPGENTSTGTVVEKSFARSPFKHFARYFIVANLILLNVATVMSSRSHDGGYSALASSFQVIGFYLFVGLVNVLFLVPAIFEVNQVIIDKDKVTVSLLFWRSTFNWSDITSFKQPRFLKFGIIRTKRCFYLINKRDIHHYDQLVRTIRSNLPSVKKT